MKNKGITLIALVVTIIVLLILAGVSISLLVGENGIITNAMKAREETKTAQEEELRKLTMAEAAMNFENTIYVDPESKEKITIPAGFAVSQVEGENTVENGLVIIDKEGNEFVWIPCEYNSTSAGSEATEDTVYYNNDDKGDNRDSSWQSSQWYYDGGEWYDSQPKNVGEASIKAHHGFYVARYEAGVPEEASFYVSEDMTDEKLNYTVTTNNNDNTGKNKTEENRKKLAPVSKKGNQAWNYISQTNAKTVSENMVKTANVKSYLIDSHAWNTICRLIEKKYKTEDETKVTDSTKWGNYFNNNTTKYEKLKGLYAKHTNNSVATKYSTGAISSGTAPQGKEDNTNRLELATGICEDFKAYNIYDLAGNMCEWTTETGKNPEKNTPGENPTCKEEECPDSINAPHAVLRGGSFWGRGADDPVVHVDGNRGIDYCDTVIGFRVVLYVQ